jgi:hypothetical protein
LLCASEREFKKPKIKDVILVPPMRGIMEVNIFVQANEHQQCTHIVLIAKRLEKGGTMQPKNNLMRNGLHSILGEKKEMFVKVFLGPKNHGFVSVDKVDAERIAGEIRKIITLEEMKDVDPGELYGRMERVELQVSIDLSDVKSSRELLMMFHNPLETCLDFHRLGQGLYPNPTMQKKGSKSELLWQAATADILSRNATDTVKSLVSPGLILPVSGIVVKDGNSELSIYKSASKVIVKGVELKHDGGVVNYMIDTGLETIKRQVRVLVLDRKRDIVVSPRTPSIRVNYGSTSRPPRISTGNLRFLSNDELYKAKEDVLMKIKAIRDANPVDDGNLPDLNTAIACLSVLGVTDSHASLFNNISGLSLILILSGGITLKSKTMNLIANASVVDQAREGYLFGLLNQSVHYVRNKANFMTDLLARFCLKFPDKFPSKVICKFEDTCPSKLSSSIRFIDEKDESKEEDDEDLMKRITDAIQALAPASTTTADMELEEQVLSYTRQKEAVVRAKTLLVSMFEEFGARDANTTCFDRMLSHLITNLSVTSLKWLILLISYDSNIKDTRLAVIEYDTMSIKDLPNTLIVQEEDGDLRCLRVLAGTKPKLWEFLRFVLEKVFGPIMKAAFVRVIKKGGDFLVEQDKLSADKKKTKKKKGEANEFDKLKAFSKIKVSFSCLN